MEFAVATRRFLPRGQSVSRVVRWFHALADETRLRIIECLSEGEQCVCELTDQLDIAQSRLSFHLKTLKDAGIVTDRRVGRWVYYALNPQTIAEVEQCVQALKACCRNIERGAACCE
ncbi:MAG: metalloregulator ArsR/SmtB family transcription factor [Candidatus Binatia bacterium]|nr:metalloregulator ArsR/SmtB family transcription factor [Candidatus Binatia bacterium]